MCKWSSPSFPHSALHSPLPLLLLLLLLLLLQVPGLKRIPSACLPTSGATSRGHMCTRCVEPLFFELCWFCRSVRSGRGAISVMSSGDTRRSRGAFGRRLDTCACEGVCGCVQLSVERSAHSLGMQSPWSGMAAHAGALRVFRVLTRQRHVGIHCTAARFGIQTPKNVLGPPASTTYKACEHQALQTPGRTRRVKTWLPMARAQMALCTVPLNTAA